MPNIRHRLLTRLSILYSIYNPLQYNLMGYTLYIQIQLNFLVLLIPSLKNIYVQEPINLD